MTCRILIVDDDQEFNDLLTDVFAQASYDVETASKVSDGLRRLEAGGIDLVVTDYRMPGQNGLEFVQSIRALSAELPIVVVSGFLDSAIIRELIQHGVGGVFLKPLNVFSLLKKAKALIEQRLMRAGRADGVPRAGFGAQVEFGFRAFPCRDTITRDFAHQLFERRNFPKHLLLVAEPGEEIETIAEDLIMASDRCPRAVFLRAEEFSGEVALEWLTSEETSSREGLTIVVSEAGGLTGEQWKTAHEIARGQGAFAAVKTPRRFIFGLPQDLDLSFDEGLIDEDTYLALGINELKVPAFRELEEDLPVMAEMMLQRFPVPRSLESAARPFLQRQDWAGNRRELIDVLHRAAKRHCRPVLSVDDFRAALAEASSARPKAGAEPETQLESYLRQRRNDYLEARELLLGSAPPVATASSQ